jgi:hypothetical protein
MHYDATRGKYTVRWAEDGRRRIRRFDTEEEAVEFEASVTMRSDEPRGRAVATSELSRGDGIYAYATRAGLR